MSKKHTDKVKPILDEISALQNNIQKIKVFDVEGVNRLSDHLDKVIDMIPREKATAKVAETLVEQGCAMLDDLNVYRILAETVLHPDRPKHLAKEDKQFLVEETQKLKRTILDYLQAVHNAFA